MIQKGVPKRMTRMRKGMKMTRIAAETTNMMMMAEMRMTMKMTIWRSQVQRPKQPG
jgi:hypothetical protein